MVIPSYPDVHVTGAVHHYVRIAGAQNLEEPILYLGTAEITPIIQEISHGQDVMNDIAGKTLPLQRTDDGSEAIIAVALTYFSKEAHAAIKSAGIRAGRRLAPGIETRWSRGGLKFGVTTIELWQVFENYFNPNTVGGKSAGLEPGFYWPQCELVNADFPKSGTQAQTALVVFTARPVFAAQANPQVVNAAENERGWALYRNEIEDFPAEVLVPQ